MLSKKHLLPILILLLILVLLPITYLASKKQQELRGRAATTKALEASDTIVAAKKPDYAPGVVLVKLKIKTESKKSTSGVE